MRRYHLVILLALCMARAHAMDTTQKNALLLAFAEVATTEQRLPRHLPLQNIELGQYQKHRRRNKMRRRGNIAPTACPQCSSSFSDLEELNTHMLTHAKQVTRGSKRKLLCPWQGCISKPDFRSLLQIHLRTHTKSKPFACGKCGRKCSQKANRDTHEAKCLRMQLE